MNARVALIFMFIAFSILFLYIVMNSDVVSECTLNGGRCYGFGDFAPEGCEDHNMTRRPYDCPQITVNTQCCG